MPQQVFAARFYKNGGSWGVTLPRDVRERMALRPGDLIIMAMYGNVLVARRAARHMIVERDEIPAGAIPPGEGSA